MSDSRRRWGKLRRLPSGRVQASFTVNKSRYFATSTFEDEEVAATWLGRVRDDIELTQRRRETWTPPEDVRLSGTKPEVAVVHRAEPEPEDDEPEGPTLRTHFDEWLKHADLRDSTRIQYERLGRRYIKDVLINHRRTGRSKNRKKAWVETRPGLGDVRLKDLDRKTVLAWWRSLPGEHPRAQHQAFSLLHDVLGSAVEDELITANPASHIRGAGKPSQHRPVEMLEPIQVIRLADAIKPPRLRLLVLLAGFLGLRSGELRALRRSDIQLGDQPMIHIRRGLVRTDGVYKESKPKTNAAVRSVAIPEALVMDIELHLDLFAQKTKDGLIFHCKGRHITDSALRKSWIAATEKCGLSGLWIHDLRHIAMTSAAINGATLRELQAIAGHASASAALRYQSLAQGHMREVTSRMSAQIEAAMGK